jgi:hypothetical protein
MALSSLDIANLGLSALGVEDSIASFSEASVEAAVCNRWYEPVRDLVFRAAPWDALEAHSRLATMSTRDDDEDWVLTDPTPGYLYAFSFPSDMIRPRYLTTYERFKLTTVNGSRAIVTNIETPILCYSKKITDPSQWDIDLQHAVVYALAAHICKAVTGKDSDLQNMFSLAKDKIDSARMHSDNNSQDQPMQSVAPWISARGYSANLPGTRYIYPPDNFQLVGMNNLG